MLSPAGRRTAAARVAAPGAGYPPDSPAHAGSSRLRSRRAPPAPDGEVERHVGDSRPGTRGDVLRQLRLRLPQLFVDPGAPADRRIVLTDDFGQRVQMSADQFSSLVADAKAGKLDGIAP